MICNRPTGRSGALSSVGRASGLQPEGRGFKSPSVHHPLLASQCAGFVVKKHDAFASEPTFGISRDDSGKFLNDYLENKIFSVDPFVSIDEGVSDLVEIAVEKGRKQNKNLKLRICGEHGGDPHSISFCSNAGLNYVSCSPYRVPVARLAAAQAEIKKN